MIEHGAAESLWCNNWI